MTVGVQVLMRVTMESTMLWTVLFGEIPTFWKYISPPSSGTMSKPSKKPAEVGSKFSLALLLLGDLRL
jgi:hypothetical protein